MGAPSAIDGPPATRHALRIAGLLVVLAGLVVVWCLYAFDWNWFKASIERRVSAATQREFRILGDLDVDLGWAPRLRAEGLVLSNADWSKEREMARVGRLDARIELWPLLRGELVLPQLDLDEARLVLERDAEGRGNWDFFADEPTGDELSAPLRIPDLTRLNIRTGELRYREPARRTDLRLDVATGEKRAEDAAAPLRIGGSGRYRAQTFDVDGLVESPLTLLQDDQPYRIDLKARAGATRAHVRGGLIGPLQLSGFDLQMTLSGDNLADLYRLLGVALPDTPPYALNGRFTRVGEVWGFTDFAGRVGDSDLAGDARVDVGGERLFLKADLLSKRLDFDDLAGFVGAPPQTGAGETASAEQRRQAQRQAARPHVLPDTPYDLTKLRSMDADVKLRARRLLANKLPLDDMDAHLFLEDGALRLEPIAFGVAEGDLSGKFALDARQRQIRTNADLKLRRVSLPALFPEAQMVKSAAGHVSGTIRLTGVGNSVAAMLGSADGEMALGMGRGRISNLLIELAGLDIAESVRFILGKDRTIAIRCAYGDFGVAGGVMTARTFMFDTADTAISGTGTISLRDERLDLRLSPHPKDRSLLALRSPLWLRGSFKDPTVRPDAGRLLLRGGAAAALALVAPPAALLALLEVGPGEDSGICGPTSPPSR